MIVAGTGHRELRDRDWIADNVERFLLNSGTSLLYVGMASGADLLMAKIAWGLKIPFVAVRPWKNHAPRIADRYDYYRALELASDIVNATDYESYPGAWVYEARNRYMVDRVDAVLAVLEKDSKGGTFNCVKYARRNYVPVHTIDPLMKEVHEIA
jgi:uncharacterized phage-like protein YoqJ